MNKYALLMQHFALPCQRLYKLGGKKFMLFLFFFVSLLINAQAQTTDIQIQDERNEQHVRMASLYLICPMSMIETLPMDIQTNLMEAFKQKGVTNPAVQRKITWTLLPAFLTHISLNDRIWACKFLIETHQYNPDYPINLLKQHLNELNQQLAK